MPVFWVQFTPPSLRVEWTLSWGSMSLHNISAYSKLQHGNIAMVSNTDLLPMCRILKSRRDGHHKILITACRKCIFKLWHLFYNHSVHHACINLLNTKRRLLYLKTQFVPCSKHFSSRLSISLCCKWHKPLFVLR